MAKTRISGNEKAKSEN